METVSRLNPLYSSPFRGWRPFSAASLRLIAMGLMLLDHLWGTVVPGSNWMHYLGRLAFPIFAFQLVEGFCYTSDVRRYARRLLVFGLLSEVPFNLMLVASPIYPFHQNVLFTLLLGLGAIAALDCARLRRTLRSVVLALAAVLGCCLLALLLMTDYHLYGVLTIIVFYIFRGFPLAWVGQLVAMVLIHAVWAEGLCLDISLGSWTLAFPVQGFAVAALLPIWLYNGQKGMGSRAFQYAAYFFYPLHMLLLYFAWRFFM